MLGSYWNSEICLKPNLISNKKHQTDANIDVKKIFPKSIKGCSLE